MTVHFFQAADEGRKRANALPPLPMEREPTFHRTPRGFVSLQNPDEVHHYLFYQTNFFVVGFTFTTYMYDEIIFLLGSYCIVHVFFAYGIVFDTLFILWRYKQIHLFILKKIYCNPSTFWSLSLFFIFWMNKSHVYCIWHYKKCYKKINTFQTLKFLCMTYW